MIEQSIANVRGRGFSVVLSEGSDERVLAAARRMKDEKIADHTVLAKPASVAMTADAAHLDLDGIRIVDPRENDKLGEYVAAYADARKLDTGVARRIVRRPLYFAGMMVAQGDAHAMVAGVANPTAFPGNLKIS
jgi:phosphotransacetylase